MFGLVHDIFCIALTSAALVSLVYMVIKYRGIKGAFKHLTEVTFR